MPCSRDRQIWVVLGVSQERKVLIFQKSLGEILSSAFAKAVSQKFTQNTFIKQNISLSLTFASAPKVSKNQRILGPGKRCFAAPFPRYLYYWIWPEFDYEIEWGSDCSATPVSFGEAVSLCCSIKHLLVHSSHSQTLSQVLLWCAVILSHLKVGPNHE